MRKGNLFILKRTIYLLIGSFSALSFTYSMLPKEFHSERDWLAPAWADTLTNSMITDVKWIQEGKVLYANHCLVCHGETGRGDGESGFGLAVPPGDFTDAFTIAESNGAIYWKISNGNGSMPSYQDRLTETQRWQLVGYLRQLQKNHISKSSKHKKR